MVVRFFAGLTVASLAFGISVQAALPEAGRPVVSIRLECDAHLRFEQFAAQIVQKVGEPLEPAKISASLKNLYATGRFQELRADAEPKGNGIEIIFVATAQYYVGVVRVEGAPASLASESIASASRLRLGQPLSEDDLTHAQLHLAATLAENGYYDAQIKHAVQRDSETQEAQVVFTIVPGRPAVLGAIEFLGHPVVPPPRLAAVARWRVGHPLTSDRLERGLFRLHQFFLKQGRLQAYANVEKRAYDRAHRTEKLSVLVEAGPVVKIHVQGARISLSNMKAQLPMYSEGVTDDFAVQQGQRSLADYFERQGYFSVKAAGTRKVSPETQEIDINYTITLGPAGEFEGYNFKGNRAVTDADLIPNLTLQARDFPFTWRGAFSHSLLERDIKALTAYYQVHGFLDARVKPLLNDHNGNQPNHLFVTFEIEEGAQTQVGHLTIAGVDAELGKTIESFLATKPGKPYSPTLAQTDRESILSYLGDHGYNQATANWKASPVSPTHEVDIAYDIKTGPQEIIQRVILMGNLHARQGIIQRELLFQQGAPVSQTKMADSQRNLYDLGIFNQVQIAPQDPQSPETQKNLLVRVEESRRWTVGYGGGLEAQRLGSNQPQGQLRVSPRASLDLTRIDIGGRDQTFTIRGRLSDLEKTGGVGYLIPHLPGRRDLSLRLDGIYDQSRDVATFSAERDEASVSVEKRYSPSALLVGRYTFRHVLVDPTTLHISPDQVPIASRPARIAMLGASYINDRRDNPADATKGSYWVLDAGMSAQRIGSQADFIRVLGQYSTYYRIGPHLTLARNTRIGIESPYGGLRKVIIPATPATPRQIVFTNAIPLPEEFFLGGSESHRGFSINQAGPRDPLTGFPIGGNALFLNSFELRVSVEENRLGFVLFHDAGNVFSSSRRMRLLKLTQNSPTDLDYTSHAIGVGVRYMTPVGPLRFDIGYNLNPPRYQVQGKSGLEVLQLSHIQFFLGVGQTF